MTTDLSTIDLATINAAHEVIVSTIRNKVCQWEQKSSDLATDGRLSNAAMVQGRLKVSLHSPWRVCEHWVGSAGFLPANGRNPFCRHRSAHCC